MTGSNSVLVNHSKGIISKEEYGLNDPPPFDDAINQLSNNLVFRTDLKVCNKQCAIDQARDPEAIFFLGLDDCSR